MDVVEINPVTDSRWNDFVRSHPYGSFYHLAEWAAVLQQTFHYQPHYLVVKQNGAIQAGLPLMFIDCWLTGKRFVSLPRTPYCDPLVNSEAEMTAIVQHLKDMMWNTNSLYFELRPQFNETFLRRKELKAHHFFQNHIIKIENDLSALWKSFHRSCVRQRVNKARRTEVRMRLGKSEEDLRIFYQLYKRSTMKHLVPAKPFSFFRNLWNVFHPENKIILLLAELDRVPIAGNVSFVGKNTWHFEFLGLEYDFISHSPGHLLVWEALQMAHGAGMKLFDFGLTPVENEGLSSFKRHWHARETKLNYYYFPELKGYKEFALAATSARPAKHTFYRRAIQLTKITLAQLLYQQFG